MVSPRMDYLYRARVNHAAWCPARPAGPQRAACGSIVTGRGPPQQVRNLLLDLADRTAGFTYPIRDPGRPVTRRHPPGPRWRRTSMGTGWAFLAGGRWSEPC